MAHAMSRCDSMIPAKRPAPPDTEPYRLSRSMTADHPTNKYLLLDNLSPPAMQASTRRRVNPESLAIRLGPELVAELERYVEPGAVEMPSFAIRQEIQMRFNVDRRHIYDWFHSKGLRVTKEDKRATVEQKTDAMRMHRRIRRSIAPVLQTSGSPSNTATINKAQSNPDLSSTAALSATTPASTEPKPEPPRPWISAPANHVIRLVNSTLDLPPRPPPGTSRTYGDSQIDNIRPIFDHTVLDRKQREAYYNTLSRILGPADGIQEEVGSYKAHMERQMAIYYERILPCYSSSTECYQPGTATNVDTCPQLTDSGGGFTSDSDLSQKSGNLVSDSASREISSELSVCNTEDYGTWRPEDLATLISDAFPDFCEFPSSETVQDQPSIQPSIQQPRPKAVSFALNNYSDIFLPTCSFSQFTGPIFNSSSSSLAGALDEFPLSFGVVQEAKRRSKDWVRPRMGRARAYSGGGGI
ncbi:hypothetical protein BD309DRAFT_946225 [Dichomitus squalens]|nr:hypothetical protein BD309DRAFT_946225 [Dichomitus squalens]